MSNYELNKHKAKDKIKWILTGLGFLFITIFLVGLCMQLFAKDDKYKPSEWFKKPETEQTTPITPDNGGETDIPETAALSYTVPRSMAVATAANMENNGISAQSHTEIANPGDFNVVFTENVGITYKVINNVLPQYWGVSDKLFYSFKRSADGSYGILITPEKAENFFPDIDSTLYKFSSVSLRMADSTDDFCVFSTISGGYYFLEIPVQWTFDKVICINYTVETPPKEPVPLPSAPVKEGHTFVGWYYDRNCEIPYDGQPIYADTELYAKFEINRYNVTFNSDGGSSVSSQTVDWNTSATLFTPTRDGYAFKGWFLPNGTQYTNQAIKENTTLTAKWERNRFTVMFNSNGGSAVDNQTINLNGTVDIVTPTKTGYNFVGWYMADGKKYENQPVTDDLTLTAHWEIIMCTITFYVDGEVYETKTVEYGTSLVPVANELNLSVMSVYSESPEFTVESFVNNGVTADLSVIAEETTGADKVINTVKNNKWQIVGGVAGGVALIAVIAAICGSVKRKKR